jgi:hypothetical protein
VSEQNLAVGDLAIVIKDLSGMFPGLIGCVCEISSPLIPAEPLKLIGVVGLSGIALVHRIIVPSLRHRIFYAAPSELRKINPPSAETDAASWDECLWQPTKETA